MIHKTAAQVIIILVLLCYQISILGISAEVIPIRHHIQIQHETVSAGERPAGSCNIQTAEISPSENNLFADLTNSCWASEEITVLCREGILCGYSDGTFRPAVGISRAETASVLAGMLGFEPDIYASDSMYDDVKSGYWAYSAITFISDRGLMSGDENDMFRSEAEITREEFVVLLIALIRSIDPQLEAPEDTMQVLSAFTDRDQISDHAIESVALAVDIGIVKGTPENMFMPNDIATREQSAALIYRALKYTGRIEL